MHRLTTSDLSAILRFVHQLQLAQDLGSFSIQVVRGLRGLIGSELASYNDIDVAAQRVSWVADPVDGGRFPGSEEILGAHIHENPLLPHFAQGPDDRWLRISDLASRRAFQRTTVYNEFYRKIEAEYQIGTMFPGHGSAGIGIALNRRLRDFAERDRTMLTLLRPHLVEGYRTAFRFTELQGDIAAITRGADDLRVGLIVLGEDGDVRLATTRARQLVAAYFDVGPRGTDVLPPALEGWVRHHEMSGRADEVLRPRVPYVVERDDRRLIVRLVGEHPRRLLMFSEEGLGVDRQALEALGLTRREAEVLAWLAAGKRDQEIAVILAISPRTVQHHLEHIYDKLGVETRNAAVAIALRTANGCLSANHH
jgi:DNA-binding CsgD family transcriptional regulator